ncbi:MAG: type IV pilin N-terminal domain-containing protein [Thermoplasmata archaeon]|nr:MAG: type IV pilin N-terminal domain-containing protein [Thermoplasmata archaeon]
MREKVRRKVRKKIVWDDKGVSEIIADILILSITVVLFAVIFAFVYSLPAPNESTYADLDASVILDPTGGRINITHNSGEDLAEANTVIILYKNAGRPGEVIRELHLRSPTGDADNPASKGGYGLEVDDIWSPGEIWTYYFGGVKSTDILEVRVVDTRFDNLVMSGLLLGGGANDAPIIMERWYDPDPAANATMLNLYVYVRDPDGFGDISAPGAISADVSHLSSNQTIYDFYEVSHTPDTGLFKANFTMDKGQGTYLVTIKAEDNSGLVDRARMVIRVTYTVLNSPRIMERYTIPAVGVNGSDITVYAKVQDVDGYDNIDYVTVDIGPLENPNGSSNVVNMMDPERDGTFEYSTVAYVPIGDQYRLNFTAMDITQLEDSAHLNVSVSKFRPVISRTWTVPVIGRDQEMLTISAEVFDYDGYSDISEVMVNATNLDPSLGWESMTDPEQDGIFEYNLTIDIGWGGNKTVDFLARDIIGNEVTAQMKVFISTRNPPVILERWTDPHFPDNNSYVRIFARVMDPDGYEDINATGAVRVNIAELDRSLSFSDGWINMTDSNWDGNFITSYLVDQESGTYQIYFHVTDLGGNQANATLNVTILPYRPRFLNIWTNPQVGRNGSQIQIFANVMDPNGYADIANVTVDIVQLNESYSPLSSYWVNMTDYNQNGTFAYEMMINVSETDLYNLNFTVMDSDGNPATTSHLLLVTSYKPTIVDAWYSPKPAVNGSNVTIFAWVKDDDGIDDITSVILNVSELNTNFTWVNMTDPDENGIYENLTLINAINVTGQYNVTIVVFDTTGNSYNKSFKIEIATIGDAPEEENPTVFGMANPNAAGGGSYVYFSAYARNGSAPGEKISSVIFQWEGIWYTMTRIFENYFRYSGSFMAPLWGETKSVPVSVQALNSSGGVVATDTINLLVLYDETGGEVRKATALQKMVAWIAHDQGFVITNNKTSNKTVQVFEMFDDKDKFCHIKIGSNTITNTEKANIIRITSRVTGEIIGPPYIPDDLKFEYDGVMAGYWFFNLSFPTELLFDYIEDNPAKFPPGTNAEYFDVYMYIKDTTDDYFMTESWIVVTDSHIPDFYPYLEFFDDPDYIPGVPIADTNGDKIPDDGVIGPKDDYFTFQNTDVVYVWIVTDTTDSIGSVTFTNLEIQDFWGNHVVSNPPDQGAVGPISTYTTGGKTHYIVAVNLLLADKDPWLMGKVAYTVIIKDFKELGGDGEEFSYLAKQIIIDSPSSIMDIVSGHEYAGKGTYSDKVHGHFYENQNGYFDKYIYAKVGGTTGQSDYIGNIWSVAFEDLDQDTDREIVTGRAGESKPTLSIWENFGGGHFEEIEIDHLTDEIYSVATGQVNEVGWDKPYDIVIGTDGGEVIYYQNDGTWDQTLPHVASGIGAVPIGHGIEIGDLDNDGDGDVVVVTTNGLYVFENDAGTWDEAYTHSLGGDDGTSVAIGFLQEDYDTGATEDLYPDIVVGTDSGDVWRFLNDDDVLTDWSADTIDTNIDSFNAYVDIGNINGLRFLDVAVGCGDSVVYYNNLDGGTTWGTQKTVAIVPHTKALSITALRVGNIDGAIEDDIVISTTKEGKEGSAIDGGFINYYRNLGRGSKWMKFEVDNMNRMNGFMHIFTIEIGDADLGS